MNVELKNRIERVCGKILKKVGIKEGQIILDLGCGEGDYTIAAAKIIGNKGKIYAVDENGYKLKELVQRAKSAGLQNIEIRKTSGELNFGFGEESFDVVLLYDIFWYFPLRDSKLSELLREVYRVLKPNGSVSVYPEHIEIEGLRQKIKKTNFSPENKFQGEVIHESRVKKGQILNFGKKVKNEI